MGACHDFLVHKRYCSIVTHMQMSVYYSRTCKKEETKCTATPVKVRRRCRRISTADAEDGRHSCRWNRYSFLYRHNTNRGEWSWCGPAQCKPRVLHKLLVFVLKGEDYNSGQKVFWIYLCGSKGMYLLKTSMSIGDLAVNILAVRIFAERSLHNTI